MAATQCSYFSLVMNTLSNCNARLTRTKKFPP